MINNFPAEEEQRGGKSGAVDERQRKRSGEVFLKVVRLSEEIKSDGVGRMCSGRVILGMTDGY